MWICGELQELPSIKSAAQKLEADLASCQKFGGKVEGFQFTLSLFACGKHYEDNVTALSTDAKTFNWCIFCGKKVAENER